MKCFIATVILLSFLSLAGAQTSQGSIPAGPEELAALIKQQFGASFSLPAKFGATAITADFDGDGIEDIAIIANSKEPIPDSYAFKYNVSDPYNGYFGLNDPGISSSFSTNDPYFNHDILVIFGSGQDGWRAAVPKAKFVLINVPFDKVEAGRLQIKKNKPPVFTIRVIESGLMESNVFWHPGKKKWKWEPGRAAE